jgi:precorrin-8X/cobalt-precorrin-8 methylmutase
MASGDNVGIVAVGNAPTALLAAIALVQRGTFAPDLIVGVPVGFVNAAESKDLLVAAGLPAITVLGRRGGSPIAAAIVNALLKMA